MEHAWLDSLSEDWVSQPGSEDSVAALPTGKSAAGDGASTEPKSAAGRIPHVSKENKTNPGAARANSSNVLSERSFSEINILPTLQRTQSKLAHELKVSQRGRQPSRSISVSTVASVVHNTVNHRSLSASPAKSKDQTPEWKRRLIYGDLAYGEQRDLFTSAGVGLKDMFKPPASQPQPTMDEQSDEESYQRNETTLPSSPPPYNRAASAFDVHGNESLAQRARGETRPAQKGVTYRMTEAGAVAEDSVDGESSIMQSASGQCPGAARDDEGLTAASFSRLPLPNDESRKVSGQSVICNEDFSPVYLTRRSGPDGKINFAPTQLPPDQLRQRLEKLHHNQMASAETSVNDGGGDATARSSFIVDNSDEYGKMGGFINFDRGGQSSEGSFRHRLLSPTFTTDTSEMLPEESLQASTPKQFPTIRVERQQDRLNETPSESPVIPAAPHPSPEKRAANAQANSGSPLKLFGPYDTFTNQTLLRRISQFEDQSSSRGSDKETSEGRSREEATFEANPAYDREHPASRPEQQPSNGVSKFGAGELDGYEFNEGFSYSSDDFSAQDDNKENERPGQSSVRPREPGLFREVPLSDEGHPIQDSQAEPASSTAPSGHSSRSASSSSNGGEVEQFPLLTDLPGVLATPQHRDAGSESKRPRTSPTKDPTPKRRRTLHRTDVAYGADDSALGTVQVTHQHMQAVMGRQRKDAQLLVTPGVLAMRHVLRQRTPTPQHRVLARQEAESFVGDYSIDGDQSADLPQGPSKAITLVTNAQDETHRKPSIKTEDFINEANKIMAMIRGKTALQNGLSSVEESEAEHADRERPAETLEESAQESTREPFSRPPSREGRPIPRMSARQQDPELADRLKKYEERSDMGDIISSSVRSLGLAHEAIRAAREVEHHIQDYIADRPGQLSFEDSAEMSDPPNVRISFTRRHNHEADGAQEFRDGYASNGSGSGSWTANLTERSIPTGSSRGSDTRRTIAPQSVSHLIPDQVGNMILDRQRNIWIKRRGHGSDRSRRGTVLPSEVSEEDPFADIPDLSVDVTKELQHLRFLARQNRQARADTVSSAVFSSSPARPPNPSPGDTSIFADVSQEMLDYSQSLPDVLPGHAPPRSVSNMMKQFAETKEEEVEHEISLHEGRMASSSPRPRNLTISFSSPIASIIQDVVAGDSDEQGEEHGDVDGSTADISQASVKRGRRKVSVRSQARKAGSRSRSTSRPPPSQHSNRAQPFFPRPVSRIDERDEDNLPDAAEKSRELSIIGDTSVVDQKSAEQRRTSLSFVVQTPARPVAHPRPENAHVLGQYVGTLSLTPLSNFTAHHDQSYGLEVSYVLGDQHLVTGDGSKKVMSLAVRDLVGKLSEVEPFEPYWEDMEELDIHGKRLSSLHMLDEFCGGIVKLDASENAIRNLDGIPERVRQLKITHNQLSEMTSWSHLMNLQYLDVSNNDIKSLAVFRNLVHLRTLTADNSGITSLDGIKYHDGLQTLRARGNLIEDVDFDGTKLQRLTDLDLEGNQIKTIANLDQLSELTTLNLKGNRLEEFAVRAPEPLAALKYLTLSDNQLTSLDIRLMPSLRLLHLDRNRLVKITGSSKARRLDSLSLREQAGAEPLDLSFLGNAYEMRKLFLSGNRLGSFEPPVDFLNLQLLDLANCGLQSLPETLGQMMPNLRVANLNFNALSDVAPLSFVPRLKRLLLAGNRLASAPAAVEVLQGFPYLAELDLRDNPITQGFYAPLQLLVRKAGSEAADAFRLPDADAERDAAYGSRLDMETRMRRRLYERVMADACRRMRKLDGLPLDRDVVGLRDEVWRALAASGVLVNEDGSRIDVGEGEGEENGGAEKGWEAGGEGPAEKSGGEGESVEESRWDAEDSFA